MKPQLNSNYFPSRTPLYLRELFYGKQTVREIKIFYHEVIAFSDKICYNIKNADRVNSFYTNNTILIERRRWYVLSKLRTTAQ